MQLFQLLATLDPEVTTQRCKIHLARWNGLVDPLDHHLAGGFDEWQMGQNKRNFERPFVLLLIEMDKAGRWQFAGTHSAHGCAWRDDKGVFWYELVRRPSTDELDGRLVVAFERRGRQSYLCAENWTDDLRVDSISPEHLTIGSFPGYAQSLLSRQHLDIVVRQQVESWKSALGAVCGVYVIVDRQTGKLYVGSATVGEGIWSRWSEYSRTGHGGNKELKQLLAEKGAGYAEHFQFGILEIADLQASPEYVPSRESYWKDLHQSRVHGLNAN